MLSFSLFGIPIVVQPFFWVISVLLGLGIASNPDTPKGAMLAWVITVFLSVLIHELGHAVAIRAHRLQPSIELQGFGGATTWPRSAKLSRLSLIVISLAGPFAGFALALGAWVVSGAMAAPSPLLDFLLSNLVVVNLVWGVVNLLPVIPFDGGHVLEHALGPKRERTALWISTIAGVVVAIAFAAMFRSFLGAIFFGMGAMQSYQRLSLLSAPRGAPAPEPPAPEPHTPPPQELVALRAEARKALESDNPAVALALAQELFQACEQHPPQSTLSLRRAALEIAGWAELGLERKDDALDTLQAAEALGPVDAAFAGAVHFARGNMKAARKALEAARQHGDNRKEVVGPLIQIAIQAGEIPRAAAIALDVVDSLSDEDVRAMVTIARDGHAEIWSAQLTEALFARTGSGRDAYDAARDYVRAGQLERSMAMLKTALRAGAGDRNVLLGDEVWAPLRGVPEFEALCRSN